MSPPLPVSHVSLASLQGNVKSHAARQWLPLARCAIQGSGGRGAGGGGAGGGGGRSGGRTPSSAARGAGGGADGSGGLGSRDAPLLLAGLLLLGLQRLTTNVMVLLPVLVLAEGAAVARCVAAAARFAGLAAAVPAALRDTRMGLRNDKLSDSIKGSGSDGNTSNGGLKNTDFSFF